MATQIRNGLDAAAEGIRRYRRRLEEGGLPSLRASEIETRMLQDLAIARRRTRGTACDR
jgi:hypothetical protein